MGDTWDENIIKLGGSILQSQSWSDFQRSQGVKTHLLSGNNWSCLLIERTQKGFKYLYAPYGPVISGGSATETLQVIKSTAVDLKFDFVRLEPVGQISESDLVNAGASRSSAMTVNPVATQLIDLYKTEEDLEGELHNGHRRYIRAASRSGIEISQTTDPHAIEDFLAMLRDTTAHDKFRAHPDEYYQALAAQLFPTDAAKLFFASHAGQKVAGVMVFDFGDTRAYAHAAAFQALNRPLRGGLYLAWQIILNAKQAGFKTFDFWGIAPNDDPSHPLAGVTLFKTRFGGQTKHFIGAWDLPVRKNRFRMYQTIQKARRTARGR